MPMNHDRIREFLDLDEGDPPPVFVGRDAVLDDILDTARRKAGRAKVTRVLQGAPGAGKSSLLNEMQKRWPERDGDPRVVYLFSSLLADSLPLALREIMAAGAMEPDGWRRMVSDRLSRIRSIGFGGISIGIGDKGQVSSLYDVALLHPSDKWKAPVIVAVDEVQRLFGSPHTPEARFLQAIHDGSTGLPLTLVLGGLSDTAARAGQMQLTRIRNIHQIAGLAVSDDGKQPVNEPRAFVEGMCDHFGLDPSRHLPELHDLTDLCDGWPRHLHYAAVALAEDALRVDGDMRHMDWPGIHGRTLELRHIYYQNQFSGRMQESYCLVAAVMADVPDPVKPRRVRFDRAAALASIVRHRREGDSPEDIPWRLPEDTTPGQFLKHLVHQGALYIDGTAGTGEIHSPSPSFRSHLIEAGAAAAARPSPEGR